MSIGSRTLRSSCNSAYPRLLCLPNLGRKTIEEIEDWLAAQGLTFEDTRRQTLRQRKEAEKRRRRLAQSVLSRIEVSGPHILAKLDPEELDAVKTALEEFSKSPAGVNL